MDNYKETFETWNKIAHLYQERFMEVDLYNETYNLICNSMTKEKAKILEVGCGPANISKYLLSKRPDFSIYGVDIAPNMIEFAKKNNPTANFDVMDIRNINEIKTTFDGIICGFCLPYLSDLESSKLIFDSYNLLNDNGFLYISFISGDPNNSGFKLSSTGYRAYFYYHELATLKKQLIDNNFEELKTFNFEFQKTETEKEIHIIVTARKK